MRNVTVAAGFHSSGKQFDTFKLILVNKALGRNYPLRVLRIDWELFLHNYLNKIRRELEKYSVSVIYRMRHNFYYLTDIRFTQPNIWFVVIVCGLAHTVYLAVVLRQRQTKPFRTTLAVSIMAINLCSIVAGCGLLSFMGFRAPYNLLQAMPFILMSVGADNMVILVLCNQSGNQNRLASKTFGTHIGRTLNQIGPSLRINALCAIACSCLAANSTNAYSQYIAIYLAVILTVNWLLQETCFIAILSLDLRRRANNRCDPFCVRQPNREDSNADSSVLDALVKNRFLPLLRSHIVQVSVFVLCIGSMCACLNMHFFIVAGENMDRFHPHDSNIQNFVNFDRKISQVGPPVYFVVAGGVDFSIQLNRIIIDTEYEWSIPNQIRRAGIYSRDNYIHPTAVKSWWDDFEMWLRTPKCCRRTVTDDKYCQPDESKCLFRLLCFHIGQSRELKEFTF